MLALCAAHSKITIHAAVLTALAPEPHWQSLGEMMKVVDERVSAQ
jgi:hypothetical protein